MVMLRALVLGIVMTAAMGAYVSGSLLMEHDGGWRAESGGTNFLLGLCESQVIPSAKCTEVLGSRWSAFDFHVGSRRVEIPTAMIGLAWFTGVAIWFTLVGRIPAWSRKAWRFVLLVAFCSLMVSVGFIVLMVLAVRGWCPLCLIAHCINLIIFVSLVLLRRVSRSRSVRRTASGLTDPPIVTRIQRRLSTAAFAACCIACLGMWFYYDAVTEAQRQWRKVFGIKQAVAALQDDRAFVLREYYAEPTVYIPPRTGNARARRTSSSADQAVIVVFTDYACGGCRCFEQRRHWMIDSVLGDRARITIRHFPAADPTDKQEAAGTPTVPDIPVSQASLAAEAARMQGGQRAFERMHALIFEDHAADHERDYAELARRAGLNERRFLADMESDAVHDIVRTDVRVGRQLGVTTTPAVFLNGRRVPDLCVNSRVFWQAMADELQSIWKPETRKEPEPPPIVPMYLTGEADAIDELREGDSEDADMTLENPMSQAVPPSTTPHALQASVPPEGDAASPPSPSTTPPDAPAELTGPPAEFAYTARHDPLVAPPPVKETAPPAKKTVALKPEPPTTEPVTPPPLSKPAYPIRSRGLSVHELDNEALIYDPETGDTHRLNETALFIWRQCDGANDMEAIAVALAHVYEVTMQEAVGHVERIIAEFEERRLVKVEE